MILFFYPTLYPLDMQKHWDHGLRVAEGQPPPGAPSTAKNPMFHLLFVCRQVLKRARGSG